MHHVIVIRTPRYIRLVPRVVPRVARRGIWHWDLYGFWSGNIGGIASGAVVPLSLVIGVEPAPPTDKTFICSRGRQHLFLLHLLHTGYENGAAFLDIHIDVKAAVVDVEVRAGIEAVRGSLLDVHAPLLQRRFI